MAFTATTLSGAVALSDTTVVIASITGLVAGNYMKIDNEMMLCTAVPTAATLPVSVRRGYSGTAQVAHASSAQVIFGSGPTNLTLGDWPQAQAGSFGGSSQQYVKTRYITNYTAAGAITLPSVGTDAMAILDGTSVLAMTLANPLLGADGDILYVVGNGKAAHTVTYTAGLGNKGAGATVGTFSTTQAQALILIAANGFWVGPGIVSGAATIVGVGFA